MGQAQSTVPRTPRSHEQLTKELANRFAEKCFTSLELYSLKDNFRSLADNEQGVRYLKEDTVARFLGMPDVLGASPVVFQMLSFLGAFPFLSEAPVVLGLEQLVLAMTLLTERYRRVLLARGAADRRRLVFRSLAVHDRGLRREGAAKARKELGELAVRSEEENGGEPKAVGDEERGVKSLGFAVDEAVEDTADLDSDADADGTDADSDELALAALDSLDYAVPLPDEKMSPPNPASLQPRASSSLLSAHIPADNFRKLLMLLLLVAPLGPQERLSACADRVSGAALDSLRAAADCVLASFLDVETSPGIGYTRFEAVMPACFPHMLTGFGVLMEHFLFSKNLDFSAGATTAATATATAMATAVATASTVSTAAPPHAAPPAPPINPPAGSILNLHLLSQLSFFLPGNSLFHRLRPLYSGDSDGFSLGSFETRVFNWRAPTILLVQGSRLGDVPHGGPEAAFAAALPPRRFPTGEGTAAGRIGSASESSDETLIFGAYVSQPWRLTNRECFGDSDMMLFQLAPTHDVFAASRLNRDYAAFVKPSSANQHTGGIGFGCPPATTSATSSAAGGTGSGSGSASGGLLPRGPLSLVLDASFEFGVMTHDCGWNGGGGGGAFQNSVVRPFSFQERFSIEALEVWGCGGDTEARVQAERWAWEAREAEARRRINLGTGDLEADRALLEMAGLIGANRSGGSMG